MNSATIWSEAVTYWIEAFRLIRAAWIEVLAYFAISVLMYLPSDIGFLSTEFQILAAIGNFVLSYFLTI